MSNIQKIWYRIYWFIKIGFKFLLSRSSITAYSNSSILISKDVKIKNSKIVVLNNAKLTVGEGCHVENVYLIIKGNVNIGKSNIIENGYELKKTTIKVDGELIIGDFNRIRSNILVRYGASLLIGNYNNINEESEIRVDEKVVIGSYNQISYKVCIWDTNTHNIYKVEKRRDLAVNKFPVFGYEYEKPRTKVVEIGDDCWIGREAAILKGSIVGNRCIVGFRTVLSGKKLKDNTTIVSAIDNRLINNDI